MRNDLEHLGRMKATAAESLEIANEGDAVFLRVPVNRGQPVIEIQFRMKILELARGLELAGFLVDGLVQGLAQRIEFGRIKDVRSDEIAFLVEELDLLRREGFGGFHRRATVAVLPENGNGPRSPLLVNNHHQSLRPLSCHSERGLT